MRPTVPSFYLQDRSTIIGKESSKVLDVNPNRSVLLIQNASSKKVWINFSDPAVNDSPSILLTAQSILILEVRVCKDSLYAISEIDNAKLTIKEG